MGPMRRRCFLGVPAHHRPPRAAQFVLGTTLRRDNYWRCSCDEIADGSTRILVNFGYVGVFWPRFGTVAGNFL